jgi:sulfatase maturation enzyme AslB (radical SAM superfamily)
MDISSFTFIITNSCNFNCLYCYQKKGKRFIDVSILEQAIDFFFPFFSNECSLSYYGGEPLLGFDLIQKAVYYSQNKNKQYKRKIQHQLTTNGSLLNENNLNFFNDHRFSITLSFDGLAQEVLRKRNTFDSTVFNINRILKYPDIDLSINSVFTPYTVDYIYKSMEFIVKLGVPNITISVSNLPLWDKLSLKKLRNELKLLNKFSLSFYKKNKKIPISNFNKIRKEGIFQCAAGINRLTLAPDEKLWGCYLFADFFNKRNNREFQKYCFGDLRTFIKSYNNIYPEILLNYNKLHMGHFYTSDNICLLCEKLKECCICPIDAALSSSFIGRISKWTCDIRKIFMEECDLFWKELEN